MTITNHVGVISLISLFVVCAALSGCPLGSEPKTTGSMEQQRTIQQEADERTKASRRHSPAHSGSSMPPGNQPEPAPR